MNDLNANCCSTDSASKEAIQSVGICSVCTSKGKAVKLITLKSLLLPPKLTLLDPQHDYHFCKDTECDVVYFSEAMHFTKDDLKVAVHQKDKGENVPVCYCFDWTPQSIRKASEVDRIPQSISEHIKTGRCGCEVNNPQGSCCLGNVNAVIKQYKKEIV